MLFARNHAYSPVGPPPAEPRIPRRPRRGPCAARGRVGGGARGRPAGQLRRAVRGGAVPGRGVRVLADGARGRRARHRRRHDLRQRGRTASACPAWSTWSASCWPPASRRRWRPIRQRQADRIAELLRLAAVAQQAVLRPLGPQVGSLAVAGRYISATAAADIGGDLYEALDTPYGVRIIIGDVRGQGPRRGPPGQHRAGFVPARRVRAGRPAGDRRPTWTGRWPAASATRTS